MSSMGNLLKYLGATLATTAPAKGAAPSDTGQTTGVELPASQVGAGALPEPGDLRGAAFTSQAKLEMAEQNTAKMTNKALAGQNVATKAALKAADAEHNQAQKVEQALAPEYADIVNKSKAADEHLSGVFAQAEQERQRGVDKYLGAVNDLKNTSVYNWWGQASTGAKVLGVLSQALAGGLQGLQGNNGPTPLDKVIDDDIKYQMAELGRKSDVARQSGGVLNQLSTDLKDRVAVEAGMRDIAYNSALQRLKSLAASQGGESNVNYQKSVAAVLQSKANNQDKVLEFYANLGIESAKTQANNQGFYQNLWGQQQAEAGKLEQAKAAARPEAGLVNVPGFELYAKAFPAPAQKLKEQIDGGEAAKSAVRDIQKRILVRDKDGKQTFKTSFAPDDKAAMDQAISQAILEVKNIQALGAISEGDKQLASATIGANSDWGSQFMRSIGITSYPAMYQRLNKFIENTDKKLATSVGRITVPGSDGRMQRLTYTPDPVEE